MMREPNGLSRAWAAAIAHARPADEIVLHNRADVRRRIREILATMDAPTLAASAGVGLPAIETMRATGDCRPNDVIAVFAAVGLKVIAVPSSSVNPWVR